MSAQKTDENTLIKDWYVKAYPNDPEGNEINPRVPFQDLFNTLDNYQDIYELLGDAVDSLMRERIFQELAKIMKAPYKVVYDQWLLGAEIRRNK